MRNHKFNQQKKGSFKNKIKPSLRSSADETVLIERQPRKSSPVAAVKLSGQQPNSVSEQLLQPSRNGPSAGVSLSGQQPKSVSLQAI